ncbi:MAG: hypothetical protein FWH15_07890 [Betaproteobacteria bacterium]|nr:hypothetical protein [Betaproteobacteria bacterium]
MGWAKTIGKKKVNNHLLSKASKKELRRLVLEKIGNARVFDAFAGSGQMYKAVWSKADYYVGCDLKWYKDKRLAFVADNRRVMRAIDLNDFNIFDLDAYGSPWEQVLILAARRQISQGEMFGLILTDGSNLNLRLGGMPKALQQVTGFTKPTAGGGKMQDEILDRAVLRTAQLLNCDLLHRFEAKGKSGAKVKYIGLIF